MSYALRPPELPGGEGGAFGEDLELRPAELRVEAAPEAAVGPGDDVFAPDEAGVVDQPVGDELRVLEGISRMTDDAGHENLALRELYLAPDFPFVLVADIRGFDRVSLSADLK